MRCADSPVMEAPCPPPVVTFFLSVLAMFPVASKVTAVTKKRWCITNDGHVACEEASVISRCLASDLNSASE